MIRQVKPRENSFVNLKVKKCLHLVFFMFVIEKQLKQLLVL